MIPALVVTVCCCGITQRVSDSFSSHESGGIAVCASVFREAGELHQMIYKPIDQWLLTLCWSMLIFVLIYSDIYIYGPTWCYAIQFCEGLSQFIIYSMWSQLKDWWTDVFFLHSSRPLRSSAANSMMQHLWFCWQHSPRPRGFFMGIPTADPFQQWIHHRIKWYMYIHDYTCTYGINTVLPIMS